MPTASWQRSFSGSWSRPYWAATWGWRDEALASGRSGPGPHGGRGREAGHGAHRGRGGSDPDVAGGVSARRRAAGGQGRRTGGERGGGDARGEAHGRADSAVSSRRPRPRGGRGDAGGGAAGGTGPGRRQGGGPDGGGDGSPDGGVGRVADGLRHGEGGRPRHGHRKSAVAREDGRYARRLAARRSRLMDA